MYSDLIHHGVAAYQIPMTLNMMSICLSSKIANYKLQIVAFILVPCPVNSHG